MTDISSHKRTSRHAPHSMPLRPLKLWQDRSTTNQEVRIEIIPMIDVIFCILTFFILAAVGLSRQQAISLNLPKASTGTPQMREMLVVSLDDLGQVYVEQQLVTKNQLFQALRNYHQFNPSGLMVLHAARNSSYNEVVQVLDMLREVGGDRVALATLPGEAGASEENLTPTYPYPNNNALPPGANVPGGSYNSLPQNVPPALNSVPGAQTTPSNPQIPNVPPAPNTTPSN
jgi:biopolymer transport protein ExbD